MRSAASSPASAVAAILEREAPAIEPEGLNRVIQACLAKDPDDRFQSARDLKRAIEWGTAATAAPAKVPTTLRKLVPWATAAIFATLALLVWLRLRPRQRPNGWRSQSFHPPASICRR